MKFIGQYIQSFIARFRNDVYLEDISTGTIASGGNLGLDSNNKIVKATEATGDITGVSITTDSGGGSKAEDTSGSADFSILGTSGVGVTNSGATITATSVPGEIDHDSLLNFAANEHFTQANITTVGTIGTGVWQGTAINATYLDGQSGTNTGDETLATINALDITELGTISSGVWEGTAIATDQQKHLAYFDFKGYGTTDGTNYERQQIMTDNKAPFLHSVASGTDGLDDLEHFEVLRLATHIMPRAGVLKLWKGWGSSAGAGTINISIVKITPVANTTDDVTPVLVKNAQFTAVGNTKIKEINETSFSVGFAAGDMLYTVVLGSAANKTWYLSSTLEVEWS